MDPIEEKPKDESQQVSQPAGEARGSDLPPQGQGGPHLPDVSEPTSRSLSEQFESGPGPVEPAKGSEAEQPAEEPHETEVLTTDPPHRCFVCKGPDHRACGCEAAAQKEADRATAPPDQAGSRMNQELVREDANAEKVLEDVLGKDIEKKLVQMAGEMSGALMGVVDKFEEFKGGVLDGFGDLGVKLDMVVSQLDVMIEAERSRADLLKDIQNVGANKN